jgi:hypothetical protein
MHSRRAIPVSMFAILLFLCSATPAYCQIGFSSPVNYPVGIGPGAGGSFSLDAQGNISGTQTRSVGGSTAEETIKGTGTVNDDCTATYKVDVYDGAGNLLRTAELAGVFVDKERELRAIFASLVLPNGASLPPVITINAKKTFHEDEN